VPSRLADKTALPLGNQARLVTGALWSAKVTKQKPLARDHTLTCMAPRS
jgi:hypothetical protein